MKLKTFFEKFAELADEPSSVPRMRRFILDLAVRGKLVAQNATDEPANELLKCVQAEKERLVKAGEIKKQEQLPPVVADVIPFVMPAGWEVSQLGDIAVCLDYMREPINATERELRIAGKAKSELYPYYGATQQQGWIDDYIFDAELVLLGEDGVPFFDDLRPKAYLVSGKSWVNNHAHVFRGLLVSNTYVMHWLNTFDYTGRVAGSTRSKLNQAKAVDIPIALPPLAEQKRIVAKVEELMALCDRLEAQQQERETRHAALARASLARFSDAPTPANLQFLFHSSFSISPLDLRKSILTLAVQGKLVRQDPNDSPVQAMLRKIEVEKKRLADKGELKADKKAWLNSSPNPPHDIPASWCWVRLQDVFEISRGGSPRPAGDPRFFGGSIPWITVGEVTKDSGKYLRETATGLTAEGSERSRFINPGDLLLTNSGATLGVPKISRIRGCMNDGVAVLRLFHSFDLNEFGYLYLTHQTAAFRNVNQGMGQPNLNTPIIAGWFFPLPPLAEQRRIVAKVEQLMALVDALETQLAASRATAAKLLAALVAELTGTPSKVTTSAPTRSGTGRRGRPQKS